MCWEIHPVAHQPADGGILAVRVDHAHGMAGGQCDELIGAAVEQWISAGSFLGHLYSKMSLRFSSNSALSISPLANRSFKTSIAREAVS
jgi:hypothetical protein